MARSITEIKQGMTEAFTANDTIKALYDLTDGKTFEEQFSKASLESILFYIVAVAVWTLESLFDLHKQEVTDLIDELKPHTRNWYRNKALAFQFGQSLVPDTDTYDNTGLTAEEVEGRRVVKYAAVVEVAAVVYVKVAGGEEGNRHPLSEEECTALKSYFKEVKDAGVALSVVNREADRFGIDIDIYYNPQIFNGKLERLDGTGKTVHDTITDFVENLQFNGEYRNSALINALSAVEGVELIDLHAATANGAVIAARCTPESGYFSVAPEELNINAIAYEVV